MYISKHLDKHAVRNLVSQKERKREGAKPLFFPLRVICSSMQEDGVLREARTRNFKESSRMTSLFSLSDRTSQYPRQTKMMPRDTIFSINTGNS